MLQIEERLKCFVFLPHHPLRRVDLNSIIVFCQPEVTRLPIYVSNCSCRAMRDARGQYAGEASWGIGQLGEEVQIYG
jgi:hypothetical protein